jgi:Glycosyl transferase family 8
MSVSPDATFFTVADTRYFLGVSALINSLRLCGHEEEIVILDCGLTSEQRLLLAGHCTIKPLADFPVAANPTYYKLTAPRAHSAEKVVIIDSDMIVTGSLKPLLATADAGHVVAYPDPETSRWFAEWESIFELAAVPRKDIYVNAGLLCFSRARYPELLEQWWEACQKTLANPTIAEGATGPTSQADQDALNAVLMSRYPAGVTSLRPADEAPQAEDLRRGVVVVDERTLACQYRGQPTLVLHAAGNPKPWRTSAGMRRTAFVRLLRRLLTQSDVAIRPPKTMIPIWLQEGVLPDVVLSGLHWRTRGHNLVRRVVGRAIGIGRQHGVRLLSRTGA